MARRILIVDDSSRAREQVCDVLVASGFEVSEAADGNDALTQVQSLEELSLILLDVNMPGKNGVEVLREIRCLNGAGRDVPVVMLTSEERSHLIREARIAGAKAWLVKPLVPALLIAAVSKIASERLEI